MSRHEQEQPQSRPSAERDSSTVSLAEAAVAYADNSWPVFPLHGKLPYKGTHGHKEATLEQAQITSWWKQHPGANIGLATGQASGVLVLDVDVPEGYYNRKIIEARYERLPDTRTSRTANGGLHFFYRYPRDGNEYRGTVGLDQLIGLDIRAEGNYIVLPPSRLFGRKAYTWAKPDLPIAPAPDWLLTLLVQAEEQKHTSPQTMRFASPSGDKWLSEAIARASEGNRNQVGFWLACQLRDDGLSSDTALHTMLAYANRVPQETAPYTSKEAMRSLKSAYSRPPRDRAKG